MPKALVKPGEDAHIGSFGGVSRVVLEETTRSQIFFVHHISCNSIQAKSVGPVDGVLD